MKVWFDLYVTNSWFFSVRGPPGPIIGSKGWSKLTNSEITRILSEISKVEPDNPITEVSPTVRSVNQSVNSSISEIKGLVNYRV